MQYEHSDPHVPAEPPSQGPPQDPPAPPPYVPPDGDAGTDPPVPPVEPIQPGAPLAPASPPPAGSAPQHPSAPQPVKFLVAGGFGVGKTTMVTAISEIEPLTTEATMTAYSEGHDDLSQLERKTSTTVAMDFGRITVDEEIILYLFGTPGQERFWFMWDDLVEGALGAVVLLDTRRIEECFAAVDYFENRQVPFVAAVNQFPDAGSYSLEEIREALALSEHVPLVRTDARSRDSVKMVLIALLDHLISRSTTAVSTSRAVIRP